MELLIIAALVMFLAGPTALGKLVGAGRSVQKAKRDLKRATALPQLLGGDDDPDEVEAEVDPGDPRPDE